MNGPKRLALSFLLALLSVSMAVPACSVFSKCIAPELKSAEHAAPQELGDEVALFLLCDPTFNAGAVPGCALAGLEQLEVALGPGGKATIDCIVTYWQTNGSATLQSRAKAMAVKRGIVASSVCAPTLETVSLRGGPEAGQQAHNLSSPVQFRAPQPSTPSDGLYRWGPDREDAWFYSGETVAHAAASCDARCSGAEAIGSPGGDCLCWRGPRDARGGWVAAR